MHLHVLYLSLSFPPKLVFFSWRDTHHLSAVFHVFHVDGVTRVTFHLDDVTTCSHGTSVVFPLQPIKETLDDVTTF